MNILKSLYQLNMGIFMQIIKNEPYNRYKNPHDGVRVKFNNDEPLNKCDITYDEYVALRRETTNWSTVNRR